MNILVGLTGCVALATALGVVTFRQTIYCALSLVLNVISLAVLFLLLNAQFLFAVQLIIYAGAVMVLFIFIIALLNPEDERSPAIDMRLVVGAAAAIALTVSVLVAANSGIAFGSGRFQARHPAGAPVSSPDTYASQAFDFTIGEVNRAGNVQTVGGQLFTTFLLPFEITSLLLLVAAVGAVYLTRRERGMERN